MTALAEASPRTRLRVAAETAPGARVLVAVDDVLAVLAGRDDTPTDLDELTGYEPVDPAEVPPLAAGPRLPAPELSPEWKAAAEQARADRVVVSRHVVVLPVSREGARRLAEAAWETGHLRDHGSWMSPHTAPGCSSTLDAAHRALTWLAAQPEHDQRRAGDPR